MLKEFNDPDRGRAYYLAKEGKIKEAIGVYRQMIERVPGDDRAHYNLAILLKQKGDLKNALYHFREAAHLNPDDIYALYNVGELSVRSGLAQEGVSSYRRALEVRPDFVPVMTNLARVLAAYPDPALHDPDEAVRLAEKAARIADNQVPFVLDTLSLAYEAAGRVGEADKTLKGALQLAESQGDRRLAESMRSRLARYQEKLSGKKTPPNKQ